VRPTGPDSLPGVNNPFANELLMKQGVVRLRDISAVLEGFQDQTLRPTLT